MSTPSRYAAAAANLLTSRRLRAQAVVLALCLWTVCAVDFATPGLFDRAGNIKFQDFLPLYISTQQVAQGHADQLYDQQVTVHAIQDAIQTTNDHQPIRLRLPNLYGPQVALFFLPLARFSFPEAARLWVAISLLIFFVCIYLIWKSCPALRSHPKMVVLCTLAFPALFHFVVRAQLSALVLACFTAAFLAFRADRPWLAGAALGMLVFKPQFLVAIPLVLLLSRAWKPLAGLTVATLAQLAAALIYLGAAVMQAYFATLWHLSRTIDVVELSLAPIQMHSLRSFWSLLISSPRTPWPQTALALYVLTSIVVVIIAALVWKSPAPLALRFSALSLAAVLANPHLFVYDLLVLAPALLLLADWILTHPQHPSTAALEVFLYLAFVLPLFGPISRWTHFQLSVIVMTALLWLLWRLSRTRGGIGAV
jgi:hypothetical protein